MPAAFPAPCLRLDPLNERVWYGERLCKLTPKAFAVLRHLMEHAGQLVSKQALLAEVCGQAGQADEGLPRCIGLQENSCWRRKTLKPGCRKT